jgi:hypothetical protein
VLLLTPVPAVVVEQRPAVPSYGSSASLAGCLILGSSGERSIILAYFPAVESEAPACCATDVTGSFALTLLRMSPVLPTPINPLRPPSPKIRAS